MPNSIDKNNLGVNNSIFDLNFLWTAIFRDGSKINQIDSDGTENRFQEVKDRFEDLAFFNLSNDKDKLFTVNLLEGIIGYNDLVMPYRKSEIKKNNIRLIYFRRVYKTFGLKDLKQKEIRIVYFLGYQYNYENNNNRKVILQIDNEGNFIIEE